MAMKRQPKTRYRKTRAYERAGTTTEPLRTERLTVEEVIAENTEQTIVRGTLSVPEEKPEIEEILAIDTKVKLRKVEVIPDKVIVEGTLKLRVMYSAFKDDQSVHTFHDEIDFVDFVDVEGARPGMNKEVDIVVEDVSLTRNPKCAADWDVAAVIMVTARITETREVDALVECPEGFECESEQMNLEQLVGSGSKQVLIDDEFEIPERKPDVEKVLRCMCDVEITNVKIIRNKVIIDGEVELECLYTAMKDDQKVHTFENTFNFTDFIEIEGAEQGMIAKVDVMVESCFVEEDEDNACLLSPTIVLNVTARVVENREVSVITEVKGAESLKTATLAMESLVGEECKQVVIRDFKEPPHHKPDVDKVRDIKIGDIVIKDSDVIQDKVLVRGTIEFQVIYTSVKKDQAVHMIHRKVTFKTFIDVPGARPDDNVDFDINVEWTNAKMDGCDLLIEAVLEICARVTETVRREIVTGVSLPEPTPAPTEEPEACVPGTVFNYTIQQGDTLSKLAQRYGTTVSAIRRANPEITNVNQLTVGQVIKIPCAAKG
ncbi:DUF3794 and LysM peptidoglycan-binding domain-containing protein [Desulforamulus ruminis]|uniref:Peptidoglycan-binding lysin domain protein n=1 Tax=Desulforamulus ruminis (strain ATCC 23193 / DSM 2154 / NCIMB 8452 / DL) TaxID=696281 RepID=F6DMP3_DESRL|nr:SPOCS domain-containing protein [Desulforamulus ruminis]AEG58451.1 Peptidoglycan-binding lysin domain protein [Desulforamulus ruminis DSM 2154]